jgi:hypothetical protein
MGLAPDINVAFLSAAATNPKLLETMANDMKILQSRIDNDQLDPIVSTVIRLAVDGMSRSASLVMNAISLPGGGWNG